MKYFRNRLSPLMLIIFSHGLLIAFGGIVVVFVLLLEPSQSGGFLGYSTGRWMVILLNLIALSIVLFLNYIVLTKQTKSLEIWLSNQQHLFWLFYLTTLVLGFSLPIGLGNIPSIRYISYFGRIQPSLIWLAFSSGAIWLTLLVVLHKSILSWLCKFFPFGEKKRESLPLTSFQRLTLWGLVLIYIALQWGSHLQVSEAFWLPDSIDYIFPAKTYNWNELGLWAHTKPWGAAILYKITGTSPLTIDAIQTILSTLAWLALAWVFRELIHNRWLGMVAFTLILGFSLTPSVQMWNHIIQSESLSISLMVLILAVWLSMLQNWHWVKLFALLLLISWWIGTRETNVYLCLIIACILITVGLISKPHRFYWAVSVILILFCYINMQISELPHIPRWLYPLTNIILNRILPEEEFLHYFQVRGMDRSPELMSLSGGLANSDNFAVFNNPALNSVEDWLYRKGKSTYIRFLVDHPGYTLTEPWKHIQILLEPKYSSSYAPARYSPTLGWILGTFIFPNSLWLVFLLTTTMFGFSIFSKPWKTHTSFWLILASLALFFPHFYLVWHGDAAEVSRHAIQASIQLRLGIWLLIMLSLDKMVTNE